MKKFTILFLFTVLLVLNAGVPRSVYVNIVNCQGEAFNFGVDNDNVYFEMWIKNRPDEILDNNSVTSTYMIAGGGDPFYSIITTNIGYFPTPWNEGDSLCVKVMHEVEGGHYEPHTQVVKFYLYLDETADTIFYGFEPFLPDTGEPVALTNFKSDGTGIESNLPTLTILDQNYPNPFNPITTINFSLMNDGHAKLNVYNTSGEIVSELINNNISAGNHTLNFDGSDLSAGVYYYILEADNQTITNKMILLK